MRAESTAMSLTRTCVFILAVFHLVFAEDLDWWKTTVFYQVYPRSFKDSNGDGTGDLVGLISKMTYLKQLGVGGIWLSPIYTSPMADFGYDVADYYAIDPVFGTMDNFDRLVRKANELDMKLILDFVPNHSSDEHQWFKYARENWVPYRDWYIWRDPREINETGTPLPPNDWIGSFSESVWTYEPYLQKFYYHRYSYKQPDLDYRNDGVRDAMKKVLQFWLDKGVHGFRVDSVATLIEDDAFPNVPDSEKEQYCRNQAMTFEIVQEWRQVLEEYTDRDNVTRVLMLEAYGTQEELLPYYGNETHPGAHFAFNFQFIVGLNNESKAQDYVDTINGWIDNLPESSPANWVIGNHDQHRVASRFGTDLAAGIAMLSLLLPGIGVIYNGEEIGMVNNWDISYEETLDPAGINAGPDGYLTASRDFERTPFQWDNTKDAGFSTSNKTWLPVESNFRKMNLALQEKDVSSYYHMYKRLLEARRTETITSGSLKSVAISENVIAIARDLDGAESFLVVVNLGENVENVDLNQAFEKSMVSLEVYTANVAASLVQNATIEAKSLVLQPKGSVVLRSSSPEQLAVNFFTLLLSTFLALFYKRA